MWELGVVFVLLVGLVDVVYVIYIFGFIGEFKGVVIEYCVIVNCLLWMCDYYGISVDDCIL